MPAKTINEVITQLEKIVEDTISRKDPLGIFTLVYLDVTRTVQDGIQQAAFEDGALMERLDVVFANRYIEAYNSYRASQPCTQAWQTAFDAASRFDLLVLQHLLMGMNAHINLDLGIAAASVVEPAKLKGLEPDFNKINELLTAKIDAMQDQLAKISPLLFLLDWFGKRSDERFAEFSLVKARNNAWKAANRLSLLSPQNKELEIKELDGYVAVLNKVLASPGMLFGTLVKFIKWFEVKDVGKVLSLLQS
ncbi:MAG: DUF5995 family protein [Saprospiraceae bacterium]|nr:DUF5995 family protein [Saprospiraceae bacterium]MCF8248845.1 DUF5995 family protein [Saprospiraceae bacterium]MCF8279570.1 DUF5995 family protein [Bacteroidales bacterium]MCF8310130.1 DUF5995 family protein [Saprospiraceae bacterium]MCF8439030.1 DUF5995 family protein [Saprospiraceae bacterium]